MMKNIVQRSDAVALLTLNLLLPHPETRAIAVLPLVLPVLRGEFCIVQLARRNLSPMGEIFVRTLLEVDARSGSTREACGQKTVPSQTAPCPRCLAVEKGKIESLTCVPS
jgi:hypothetical protein